MGQNKFHSIQNDGGVAIYTPSSKNNEAVPRLSWKTWFIDTCKYWIFVYRPDSNRQRVQTFIFSLMTHLCWQQKSWLYCLVCRDKTERSLGAPESASGVGKLFVSISLRPHIWNTQFYFNHTVAACLQIFTQKWQTETS